MAWAGDVAARLGASRYMNGRNMLAGGLLLLEPHRRHLLQTAMQSMDIADIDASLLTSELPINAYLDSDFEAWVKRTSQ
jgi:hypothetical protein